MHSIKVLGSGCRNCKRTAQLIQRLVEAQGIQAVVTKVEDMPSIMAYGIMRTPGVVIDEKVVHAGGVPSRRQIIGWLEKL